MPKTAYQRHTCSFRCCLAVLIILFISVIRMTGVQAEHDLDFDEMFHRHGSVMLLINVDTGQILHANQAAADFYGYTVEELEQLSIYEINQLDDEAIQQEMEAAAAEDRNFFVFRHRLADGEIRTVEVYSYPYEAQGDHLLFSIIHDITPRVLAEERFRTQFRIWMGTLAIVIFLLLSIVLFLLKRRKERLRHIAELFREASRHRAFIAATQTGAWEYNRTTGVMSCSPEYYAIRGIKLKNDDFVALSDLDEVVFNHIHADDRERARQTFYEYVENPAGMYENVFRIRHQDGSWRWILSRGKPMLDESGYPTAVVVGTHIDMTDLKEAQEKAEAANEAKSRFLSNMTHELKTPLHGIMGVNQLLETTELTEEQREYVALSKTSSETLLHIIQDILDHTKLESEYLELQPSGIRLHQLVDELNQLFQVTAGNKGIEYTAHIAGNVPREIVADGFRVRQILTNLLGNAVKFTRKGSVQLFVERQPHPDPRKAHLVFSVKDTGKGIPGSQLERIFDRFHLIPDEEQQRYQGTGLGLPISKSLADLMGGSIRVESEEGRGSTFTFECVFEMP